MFLTAPGCCSDALFRGCWFPGKQTQRSAQTRIVHDRSVLLLHASAGYYKGRIAAAIVAALQAEEGVMTADDLELHRSVVTRPIHSTYRGHTVYEVPPPTQVTPKRTLLPPFWFAGDGRDALPPAACCPAATPWTPT